MLGKLLKYDLKRSFKIVVIFYILALVFGTMSRLFSLSDTVIVGDIMKGFFGGAAISMLFSILINSLINSWVLFVKNIYGDESYLTHTLPISKSKIYLSKVLSVIIMLLSSTLVILLTLMVLYYSKENLQVLKYTLLSTAEIFDSTMIQIILTAFAVFFVELIFIYLTGLSGIIIGHRYNNHKIFKSFLFGFIIYMGFTLLSVLIIWVTGYIDLNVYEIESVKQVLGLGIILYIMYNVACYFIGNSVFNKGVDVI